MTATVTGSGTATRAPARARRPAARRPLAFPRASTTPGKVRLIRIGLVIACLGWGALAALMVEQHASAAQDVASVSEPLSLEALSRRTHRTFNVGLLVASVAGLVALAWMAVALLGGRADLLRATEHGSGPAETLAQADIAALQARGDETLNLISRTGDADFQQDFRAAQGTFSSLLTRAGQQSTAGAAVLALIMAIGSARGLSRRLAEYR